MEEQIEYSLTPHNFSGRIKRIPWPYCTRCGTLRLNNLLTAAAIRLGCDAEYHKDWPRLRNTLPKLHVDARKSSPTLPVEAK